MVYHYVGEIDVFPVPTGMNRTTRLNYPIK